MKPHEIRRAAGKVLTGLAPRRRIPLFLLREAWPEDEMSFYMGLGALILQQRVTLAEWEGTIWVVQSDEGRAIDGRPRLRSAAVLHSCRAAFASGGEWSICSACPHLLDTCPSGGLGRLLLAA